MQSGSTYKERAMNFATAILYRSDSFLGILGMSPLRSGANRDEFSINPDSMGGRPGLDFYIGRHAALKLAGATAALASQKGHMAVYLTSVYMDDRTRREFESAYSATGKRMDMGKSCVRFRKIDDLPLDVVGRAIAHMPMKEFAERVTELQSVRGARRPR